MTIINIDSDRYFVLQEYNLENFKDDSSRDEFFKSRLYLRKKDTNQVYTVYKIPEASFEEIIENTGTKENIEVINPTPSEPEENTTQNNN